MNYLIPLLFVAALACGCSKSEDKEPTPAPAPTPTTQPAPKTAVVTTPVTEAATGEQPDEADVPTVAEFEAEASEQITAENLEKELSALEKELGE